MQVDNCQTHTHTLAHTLMRKAKCTYLLLIFGQKLCTGEKVFIFGKGDDWLGQLSQVKFQQGCHRVDICITATR